MMTLTEAQIFAVESDLTHVHHRCMSTRMGEQYEQLRQEREKAAPDEKRIEELKKARIQTERDKRGTSITVREVLEPLRKQLASEEASARGDETG